MDSCEFDTEMERPRSSSSNWSWEMIDLVDKKDIHEIAVEKMKKYPAKLHAESVAKHLGVTNGLIYLPSMPALYYEDSDMPVEFRQRRYFYYLSGLDYPNCTVTYDLRHGKLYAWIPPPNSIRDVIYNGQTPSHDEISELADFDGVAYNDELDEYARRFATQRSGKIYVVHYTQAPKFLLDLVGSEKAATPREGALFDFSSLLPAMNIARAFKSPYEIEAIRKANVISAEAHSNVLRAVKRAKNEADLEAVFIGTCIKNQAKRQAYGAIVGSGVNASTLHYVANNESLKGRQLVCLDAGCEWKLYASDVTRTFPINGVWSKEAKNIYDIVERMQEECIDMVKPGASYRDIHIHAHLVATKGLLELGILKGEVDDLMRAMVTMAFFPHGLGHYVGLEVHDVGEGGNLRWSTESRPQNWIAAFDTMIEHPMLSGGSILQANQVITIEPGIYFSQYALEKVYLKDERFAKYINEDLLKDYYPVGGVRIEDDILVTEQGYENLTTAPKGEEALRIINGTSDNSHQHGNIWPW